MIILLKRGTIKDFQQIFRHEIFSEIKSLRLIPIKLEKNSAFAQAPTKTIKKICCVCPIKSNFIIQP